MNRTIWFALSAGLLVVAACGPKNRNRKPPGENMFNGTGGGTGSAASGGKWSLATTSAGSALQRITFDPVDEEHPSLSPDGGTLLVGLRVFESDGSARYPGIIAINPNGGGGRTMMTQPGVESDRASWTPDGSTFVYATNAPGTWTLVRANSRAPMSGFSVIVPAAQAPLADYPSAAPDGTVAFTMSVNKTSVIATARMDGSGMQMIQQGTHATFSPDGAWVAFIRDVGGSAQIFISDRSGGSVRQLTSGKASHVWPAWSPDGRFLVFGSNRGMEFLDSNQQRNHIWAISVQGGSPVQLTTGSADCGFPNWGVDGNIYFNSNQAGHGYDIWRMRVHVEGMGKSI
jgi:Tol biopolymer transport system component